MVLAVAATLLVSPAPNDWPRIALSPHRNGWIGRLSNHPRCQEGQKGVRAVNLISHQIILDDTLLIPTLAAKLITSNAMVEQLVRGDR